MAYRIRVKIDTKRMDKKSKMYKEGLATLMFEMMALAVEDAKVVALSRGWKLVETIQMTEFNESIPRVVGGVLAPYAAFPEFGTNKQHAQPYWRPAVWARFFQLLNEWKIRMAETYG